jgi:hypothetical protein
MVVKLGPMLVSASLLYRTNDKEKILIFNMFASQNSTLGLHISSSAYTGYMSG